MLFVTASGVSFSLFQTSLVPYVQIYNGSSYNAGACSIAAPLNTWVMLSVVYNNSSQSYSIYYNGAQCKANASVPGGMYSGYNATAEIGAYAGNYHNGYIDDVRIYNRALSVAEVQEIYNAEK
jgi:hypothetical protein